MSVAPGNLHFGGLGLLHPLEEEDEEDEDEEDDELDDLLLLPSSFHHCLLFCPLIAMRMWYRYKHVRRWSSFMTKSN